MLLPLGPPVVPFLTLFWGETSPTKKKYRRKKRHQLFGSYFAFTRETQTICSSKGRLCQELLGSRKEISEEEAQSSENAAPFVDCEVTVPGKLGGRKGVNTPDATWRVAAWAGWTSPSLVPNFWPFLFCLGGLLHENRRTKGCPYSIRSLLEDPVVGP